MRKTTMVVLLVAMVGMVSSASAAEGYPVAKAQRPLVLNAGMFEAGLDLTAGLNKDRAFKDFGVAAGLAYGLLDDLELGLLIEALDYSQDVYDAKFGGASIYARYRFIEMLGVELEVYVPGDRTYIDSFGDQLLGLALSLPFEYIAIQNMLKLHASLGLDVGFVSDTYATSGGDSPQMALQLSYGVTYNPLEQLFIDLTFGTRMTFIPDAGSLGDRTAIPVALTVGGTVLSGDLDVFASFMLADLKPAVGEAFDMRSLGVGARFRF